MKVQDLMTADVHTCQPHDPVTEAARIMWERDCGSVPIVNERAEVVGFLTDRDICMAAYTQGKALAEITVGSVMSTSVHCVQPKDELSVAEQIMQMNAIRRVPVVEEDGRIVGILSMNDLAREADRQKGTVSANELARTLAAVGEPRSDQEIAPTARA